MCLISQLAYFLPEIDIPKGTPLFFIMDTRFSSRFDENLSISLCSRQTINLMVPLALLKAFLATTCCTSCMSMSLTCERHGIDRKYGIDRGKCHLPERQWLCNFPRQQESLHCGIGVANEGQLRSRQSRPPPSLSAHTS